MIVRFTGSRDGGPCDDGPTATCPHCGADGRYVFFFVCDDGSERGAMRGCLKLFPVSQIADEHKRLIEREMDLKKRFGKDAHLNSWEAKILDAIEAYYALNFDEAATQAEVDAAKADTLRTITYEKAAMKAWRQRKTGRRW